MNDYFNQIGRTVQHGKEGGFVRAVSDISLLVSFMIWSFVQWSFINPQWPAALDVTSVALAVFRALFATALALAQRAPRAAPFASFFAAERASRSKNPPFCGIRRNRPLANRFPGAYVSPRREGVSRKERGHEV